MKLLDTIRKQLDSVEATNASKIYTPFTLFCIFFAIYFNADILGSIFLSDKWVTKSAALKTLTDRSWDIWFGFAFRVISYSLGMMVLYGLAQAAAFVWGLSNWANTALSAYANRSNYIARSEFDKVLEDSNILRKHEKELYARIAEYHKWEPEDIGRLSSELDNAQSEYKILKDDMNKNAIQTTDLTEKLKTAELNQEASSEKYIIVHNMADFYLGLSESQRILMMRVELLADDEKNEMSSGSKKKNVQKALENLGILKSAEWYALKISERLSFEGDHINETTGKLLAVIEHWDLGVVEDQDLSPNYGRADSFVNVRLNGFGYSLLSQASKIMHL